MDLRKQLIQAVLTVVYPLGAYAQAPPKLVLESLVQRVDGTSGGEITVLGTIDGGAIGANGLGIVVDRAKNRLVLLSRASGSPSVAAVGGRGSGPGEFRYPLGPRWYDAHTLTVFDARLSRLTYYALLQDGLRHLRDQAIVGLYADHCFLNGRLVTLRYEPRDRSILHWAPSRTYPALSSGLPFVSGNPRIEGMTTKGIVLCLPAAQMVVVASTYSGEVRGYSANGRLLWQTQFPDFIPLTLKEYPSGALAFVGQKRGAEVVDHILVSASRLDSDHILVQFGLAVLGKHHWSDLTFAAVESRLLRIRDGVIVRAQSDLPVLFDLNAGLALLAGGAPSPWVELRRYRVLRAN